MRFKLWLENETLPEWLYHVTTATNDIFDQGFLPASQHKKGTMLGGSFQEAVSFTHSLERAKYYKYGLEEVHAMLHEPNYLYSDEMWKRIGMIFGLDWPQVKWAREKFLPTIKREEERFHNLLMTLPRLTKGKFPLIFGGGLQSRLTEDVVVNILKVSTRPGNGKPGPQKWTINTKEEEYRIYDPENFDYTTLDVVG